MDLQSIVDSFFAPTCIVSVEKTADGRYGTIRLAAGNKKYAEIFDRRIKPYGDGNEGTTPKEFVPGLPYTEYFQQNINFEDACYRAAVLKKEVHTYAHIPNIEVWFDIYAMPLDHEDGNICYCLYSAIPNDDADSLLDTFNTSNAVNDVLKTCVKLHKANNLKDAMENVIAEIRQICNAEGCTVLLLNNEEERYSILAANFVPSSTIKRVTQFEDYYKIAISWKDMLGEEGDCIIARNREEIDNIGKINHPWYLTLVEAGVKSVVLFPLRQGREILGFIWAVNFDTENAQHIKETLELTTFFLSSHIAHYQVITRLKQMSYTDGLTGLPNRYALREHISDLIEKREKFAAVSIDFNDFKHVNNTYGFDAGNKVLIEVAARWRAVSDTAFPEADKYLTCIGGDEFFLVVSGYRSEKELKDIVSRYNDALSENVKVGSCDVYVSASFGYAEFPTDADTTDALVAHANVAMNEIKKIRSSDHILRFTPDLSKDEHILKSRISSEMLLRMIRSIFISSRSMIWITSCGALRRLPV